MKCSICITLLDENKYIFSLLNAFLSQTSKSDEIIILDGGSKDNTLNNIKDYQKKYDFIRIIKKQCSRAKGRNLITKIAKNEIIIMTDGGCTPNNYWVFNLIKPFKSKEVDVVAGFYKMKYNNKFEKAETFFLGVLPQNFNKDFLPSTRSIAFRKSIWKKVGGFSEHLKDTAEDTDFNYKLIRNNANIKRVKNAVVEWGMPNNIYEFFKKIFGYARGDAKTKIWLFPGKGLRSHNIKAIFIIIRYLIGGLLLTLTLNRILSPIFIISILFIYIIYIFQKIYKAFREIDTALIGIPLQFIADLAVMSGFISGLF